MTGMLRSDYDAFRVEIEGRSFKGRRGRIVSALAALYRGNPLEDVAKTAGVMIGTVRRWADAFTTDGFEGAFSVGNGQVYDLRKDFDAQTLRLAAETALYPGQKARLLAVASMYDGVSTKELVRMTGVGPGTLSQWRDDFNRRGLEYEYQVPDTHLQANFKANNRLYPLSRVLKVRRRARTPEMQAKLDAIILSYRDRSVEAIAETKGVSKALVASWIKAFNARGPAALDVEGGSFANRAIAQKNIDLPTGHSAESLRKAASETKSETVRLRLFTLASLYETLSISVAASFHGVKPHNLRYWKDKLAAEGIDGLSKGRLAENKANLSVEEVEDAVAIAASKRDANIIRAAAAVVFGTATLEEAATRWIVPIPSLKKIVPRVRARGAAAFESSDTKPFLVHIGGDDIRLLADYAPAGDRPVLFALAKIADGGSLKEVLSDTVTRKALFDYAKALRVHGMDMWKPPETVVEPDVPTRIEATNDIATTTPQTNEAVTPEKGKRTLPDPHEVLFAKFHKWKPGYRNFFLKRLKGLLELAHGNRDALKEKLAEAGIPQDVFEEWENEALRGSIGYLNTLGTAGHTMRDEAMVPIWEDEVARENDPVKKRWMSGVVARMQGATLPVASLISGLEPDQIRGLIAVYDMSTRTLSDLPYSAALGLQRHDRGKRESATKAKARLARDKRQRKEEWQAWLLQRQKAKSARRVEVPVTLQETEPKLQPTHGPELTAIATSTPPAPKALPLENGMRPDYGVERFQELLLTATRPATSSKYRVMIMAYLGMPTESIATAEKIPARRATKWIADFNAGGIIGLMQS